MLRLGLCCKFYKEPVKFYVTTASYMSRQSRTNQLSRLSELCLQNSQSLLEALQYCQKNGIGAFRINSRILPLKTHPQVGYELKELPARKEIVKGFEACGKFARDNNIRTTFHPDQFILLSSADKEITARAVKDLEYHAMVAEMVNADVINIHGGGAYDSREKALERVRRNIEKLPANVRERLTLENDDRVYTPAELLGVCSDMGIGLVYDAHHHRCLPDGLSVEQATRKALKTWNREPLFHISSPKDGWDCKDPKKHHDYIDVADFPACWLKLDITVEVEAKAKELAVKKLARDLKA